MDLPIVGIAAARPAVLSQDRRAFFVWPFLLQSKGQVGATRLAEVTCLTSPGTAGTTSAERKVSEPFSGNDEGLYYKSLFRAALVICCGCDSSPKLADQIPYIVKKETKKDGGVIQSAYVTCLK